MAEYIAAIADAISTAFGRMGDVFFGFLHTLGQIVPGGLPVVGVLITIAILVGWASLRR